MVSGVALTLVIGFVGVVYLRGCLLVRSIAGWRAGSFCTGLFAVWVAVVSPIVSLHGNMLTTHMIQHLLLMTIAPALIWLGEPVSAAWPVRWVFPAALGKLLGNPAFCWLSAAAALVVWHLPTMFALGMRSPTWHFIEHTSFLVAGLLFWWPVIEPWPSIARWPRWSMLLYLFLATLPCDVLSGLLVFSDRVVYLTCLSMPGMGSQMGSLSPLEDQECAAALMWTCVTVVFLIAGTILSTQMLSPKPKLQEAASI